MKKKFKTTLTMLAILIASQVTVALAAPSASFATYSSTGYYFSGSNVTTNPWSGNPYATLNTTYKGNDSTHSGLYCTQYTGTSVGNTISTSSTGTVKLTANVYFASLVTFDSTHFVKVNGVYQRKYLKTNP